MMLISFIVQFHSLLCDGFSQITSQIYIQSFSSAYNALLISAIYLSEDPQLRIILLTEVWVT